MRIRTKMKKRRFKIKTNSARIIGFLIFALYGSTMVYALFWAVTASLNEHTALILDGLALPEKLNFKNYRDAFTALQTSNASFFDMLWNSLWITTGNSLISIATVTVVAYCLGRYEFVGKKTISMIMLLAIITPVYGTEAATLLTYMKLGMYDSPLIMLKSFSALGMLTFIVKTHFENIPLAYEETAKLEGASKLRIFLQLHLPMVKSSVFSIFIMMFVEGWNNYSLPIYYMPSYPTIASGLYVYETLSKFTMNKPVYFAGVVMCAIPPMILFSLFSDQLVKNTSVGGLKQ